jgi:hypothetical protein
LETELTLIINAAIMHWKVDFSDEQEMTLLIGKVKAAVNIGLEILLTINAVNLVDAFETLGLIKIYRLGLGKLLEYRKEVLGAAERLNDPTNQITQSIFERGSLPLPDFPAFFNDQGTVVSEEGLRLSPGGRPFEHLYQLEALKRFLA